MSDQLSALHDELLHNFQAAGMYEMASEVGYICEGQIPSVRGKEKEGVAQDKGGDPGGGLPAVGVVEEGVAGERGGAGGGGQIEQSGSSSRVVVPATAPIVSVPPPLPPRTRGAPSNLTEEAEVTGEEERPRNSKRRRTASGVSQGASSGRAVSGGGTADKAGKGLRHFSFKVCEKVKEKGRTSYNEVADELVYQFSHPEPHEQSDQVYDDKNVRRRVYDALNVLMALDIIAKEKKEIFWKGFPSHPTQDTMQEIRDEIQTRRERVESKREHLHVMFAL